MNAVTKPDLDGAMRVLAEVKAMREKLMDEDTEAAAWSHEQELQYRRRMEEAAADRARELAEFFPGRPELPERSDLSELIGKLVRVAAFDLSQERIACFSAFRFLYERLLGAEVRPWLPSAFCAAAALPQIRPEQRKILLQSLSEAAATAPGWSDREPSFYPEYVEAAEAA